MTTDNKAESATDFRLRVQVVLAPVRGLFIQAGSSTEGVIVNEETAERFITAIREGVKTLREIGGSSHGLTEMQGRLTDDADVHGEGSDTCRS